MNSLAEPLVPRGRHVFFFGGFDNEVVSQQQFTRLELSLRRRWNCPMFSCMVLQQYVALQTTGYLSVVGVLPRSTQLIDLPTVAVIRSVHGPCPRIESPTISIKLTFRQPITLLRPYILHRSTFITRCFRHGSSRYPPCSAFFNLGFSGHARTARVCR